MLSLEAALKCLVLRLAYESIEKGKFAEPGVYLNNAGAEYDPLSFGPTEVIHFPPFLLTLPSSFYVVLTLPFRYRAP